MMLRTLLFLSVLLGLTLSAQAQSTTLRVQPTETTIADTGQSFTVSVLIEEFAELHAYSIELTYDPDVLTHTAITKGDVFQEYGDLFLTSGSDASAGKVLADHAILGTESVSGEESVAFRVTFETVAEGTSALAFGTTRLRDGANDSIAHGGEDGTVEVGGDAEALADLSLTLSVDDPAPDVGAEVTFTLDLTNAGPDAATGVVVNQSLPDAFTLIDASPEVGAFDADTGAWTVGTILADETVRLELRARGDET
ncbi:MAG: DUF11 domain-containing protein, partial [Bacteroidetes bacterium]|nr:DUF11 domain-containing protein [Bacteroidota bacterium]